MMEYPSLAVITPAYNGSKFLDAVVENVASQGYPRLEHFIVDDGSTDGLEEKVKAYAGRVRYLRQENRGPSAARNLGIAGSSSDIIAFLDIDDLWAPGHLRRMVDLLLANPDAGIAQAFIRSFFTAEDGRQYICSGQFRFPLVGSSIFRREAIERCGPFDESLRYAEDMDFALRCWECDILKIMVDADGLYYRRHDASMTAAKLSVVELGLLKVYKRRADRVRNGLVDPRRQVRMDVSSYFGRAPEKWDEGLRVLIPSD
jgi:glycosyltransferase involved in cell wall biosynthesis